MPLGDVFLRKAFADTRLESFLVPSPYNKDFFAAAYRRTESLLNIPTAVEL